MKLIKLPKIKNLLSTKINFKRNKRRHLFTPEAALSALPSLQINTVKPSENIAEGLRKYKNQKSERTNIEKEKIKLNTPLKLANNQNKINSNISAKPALSPMTKQNKGQLDISISSRADE